MNTQLSSISIVRLRNAAHFEFVTRFYSIVNEYDTSNGMFQEAKAAFQRAIKKEEERITTFRSSEWTLVMREAGHRRKYSMRYAPTLVRLWGYVVGLILDVLSLVSWFEFWRKTVGAYRIRPHVREWGVICRWMVTNFVEWERNRCHGGRMRYAPTHVRLWGYAIGLILGAFSWVLWFEISRITVGAYRIRTHVGE